MVDEEELDHVCSESLGPSPSSVGEGDHPPSLEEREFERYQVGFSWFFMVFHVFSWFFMVQGWFFMVFHGFL